MFLFLIFRPGFTTLEWIPPRAVRRAASCFGLPEIFRAAQNTTCYYRLVMNFPSSNWVLTFSLILRLRKTLAAVSVPLSVQSYGGLSCCKIAGYMQRDDIWWHRSSPPSKHGDGM